MDVCMYVRMHVYVCMYVFMYVCMYVCMYIGTYLIHPYHKEHPTNVLMITYIAQLYLLFIYIIFHFQLYYTLNQKSKVPLNFCFPHNFLKK